MSFKLQHRDDSKKILFFLSALLQKDGSLLHKISQNKDEELKLWKEIFRTSSSLIDCNIEKVQGISARKKVFYSLFYNSKLLLESH